MISKSARACSHFVRASYIVPVLCWISAWMSNVCATQAWSPAWLARCWASWAYAMADALSSSARLIWLNIKMVVVKKGMMW